MKEVLGVEDEGVIRSEEKTEEFIVLRAINDTNLPKLHDSDTLIFRGITEDLFPEAVQSQIHYGSIKNLVS